MRKQIIAFAKAHLGKVVEGALIMAVVGMVTWYGSYQGFKGGIEQVVKGLCTSISKIETSISNLQSAVEAIKDEGAKDRLLIKNELLHATEIANQANQRAFNIEKKIDDIKKDQQALRHDQQMLRYEFEVHRKGQK